MITEAEHDALLLIRRAGADGVAIGDIPVSAAIRLQLFGHATIRTDKDGWQYVVITGAGASVARVGWAA